MAQVHSRPQYKTCPNCAMQYPAQAAQCPHCGPTIQVVPQPNPILNAAVGVAGIAIEPIIRKIVGIVLFIWCLLFVILAGWNFMLWFTAASAQKSYSLATEMTQAGGIWFAVAGPLFIIWFIADRGSKN